MAQETSTSQPSETDVQALLGEVQHELARSEGTVVIAKNSMDTADVVMANVPDVLEEAEKAIDSHYESVKDTAVDPTEPESMSAAEARRRRKENRTGNLRSIVANSSQGKLVESQGKQEQTEEQRRSALAERVADDVRNNIVSKKNAANYILRKETTRLHGREADFDDLTQEQQDEVMEIVDEVGARVDSVISTEHKEARKQKRSKFYSRTGKVVVAAAGVLSDVAREKWGNVKRNVPYFAKKLYVDPAINAFNGSRRLYERNRLGIWKVGVELKDAADILLFKLPGVDTLLNKFDSLNPKTKKVVRNVGGIAVRAGLFYAARKGLDSIDDGVGFSAGVSEGFSDLVEDSKDMYEQANEWVSDFFEGSNQSNGENPEPSPSPQDAPTAPEIPSPETQLNTPPELPTAPEVEPLSLPVDTVLEQGDTVTGQYREAFEQIGLSGSALENATNQVGQLIEEANPDYDFTNMQIGTDFSQEINLPSDSQLESIVSEFKEAAPEADSIEIPEVRTENIQTVLGEGDTVAGQYRDLLEQSGVNGADLDTAVNRIGELIETRNPNYDFSSMSTGVDFAQEGIQLPTDDEIQRILREILGQQ